jgi:hypothetical protein
MLVNPKKDLYLAIKDRLIDQVKALKHIRLYNNQFDRETVEEAWAYPCAFIEFNQMLHEAAAYNQQRSNFVVRVYVGFESLKTEDLEIFDLVQEIYIALQGYSGQLFSSLQRIEETQDTDHDNVIVWQIDFSTMVSDCVSDPRDGLEETIITQIHINTDLDIDNPVVRSGDGQF